MVVAHRSEKKKVEIERYLDLNHYHVIDYSKVSTQIDLHQGNEDVPSSTKEL